LVDKVATIESDLNTVSTGLKARVTALEGKDTVVISYDGEHSNFTEGVPNYATPTTDADYLIADDEDKYFYWRYFGAEDGWQLISGAGGGGTGSSSGLFVESLSAFSGEHPLTPDENVDYFIGNNANGYTHYRYIAPEQEGGTGTFVKILPNGVVTGVGVTTVEIKTNENAANEWPA